MNRITAKILLLFLAPLGILLTSCESDKLDDRLESRNDSYQSLQDNRRKRIDARQDRTDAWFDRVMDR